MATLSASRVAEATMRRRSGRRLCTFFSSPSSVSVAKLRSCASSTITTLHYTAFLRRLTCQQSCGVIPNAIPEHDDSAALPIFSSVSVA